MKQFLAIFLLSLVFASCQDNAELFDEAKENVNDELSLSKFRTPEQAMEAAADIASQFYGSNSRSTKSVDRSSVVCITGGTRSEIDTLLYIVNYGNNQGYAMIAGPSNLPPIYAIVDSGQFTSAEDITNPGLQAFYNAALIDASEGISGGREPYKYLTVVKDPVIEWDIQPRANYKWGQQGIYANYCPNGVIGCTPLACAIAITYLEQPTSLEITFPNAPVNHVEFDWSRIKAGFDGNAIALLCRELGHRMGSDYSTIDYTTETELSNAFQVMRELLNDRVSSRYTSLGYHEELYPHKYIRDSGVLVVNGYPNTTTVGHSYIVDGFKYYRYEERLYEVTEGGENTGTLTPTYELVKVLVHEENNLVHVNWGWFGYDNGYFKGNLLANKQGESYDDENLHNPDGDGYIFNYNYFFTVK